VTQLVEFLVGGLVQDPGAVAVHEVAGESSTLLELTVAPADIERVKGPGGDTLRALRTVLSAAAGQRKAVLELIEPGSGAPAEELAADETTDGG
jgi:predicted RNA-binding protein YlqC (UPF0109 family)